MKKADIKMGEKYLAKFYPLDGACVTALEFGNPPNLPPYCRPSEKEKLLVRVEVRGAGYSASRVGAEIWIRGHNLVRSWTVEDDRALETRAEARVREGKVLERAKMVDTTAVIHNGRVLISVDAVESLLRASGQADAVSSRPV